MTDEQVTKTNNFIRYFLVFKEHYAIFAVICTLLFTISCLIFGEVYFSSFGLNQFLFNNISDIYLTPMSKGVILSIGMAVIAQAASIFVLVTTLSSLKYSGSDRRKVVRKFFLPTKKILIIFVLVASTILSIVPIPLFLAATPSAAAKFIKQGFTERYNVDTNGKQYSCHSIIGVSSGYIFLWNYSSMRPIIVARSVVTSIDQVVPKNPHMMLLPKLPNETALERKLAVEKFTQDKIVWSALLNKTCSQQVDWPIFKG